MKLKYLSIQNLRCIDNLELDIFEFTSLIGPNNAGKSTILRAIDIFLRSVKPDKEEWRFGHEMEPITIEAHFDDLRDWERKIPGVAGIVNQNEIRLRFICILAEGNVSTKYEANIRPVEIKGWDDSWKLLSQEIKDIAKELGIINGLKWKGKANKEIVRQHIIENYEGICTPLEEVWTSENISIPQALQQALPQTVFIPAVKDASDEARTTSTASFGNLLNSLILPALEKSDEYLALVESVKNLSTKLNLAGEQSIETVQNITQQISERISSIIEASIRLSITTPDTSRFIGSNTKILINDGVETPIHLQGHGIQRALVFALIEVIAKINANKVDGEENRRASILLFEEPELFLHPHLMRRFKRALESISKDDQWQVIISTHSPFLLNVVENPQSLVILNKENKEAPPIKKQLKEDPFIVGGLVDEKMALRASLDFHPTVNEAFFAKKVVLVEGDTETAIFNHDLKPHLKFGISQENFDNTTIVSCGGKWTIPAMALLLKLFGVPFRVIHDLDRKGLTDAQLDQKQGFHPFKANVKIKEAAGDTEVFITEDTLEHILWDPEISVSSKEKPLKSWRKIKEFVDTGEGVYDLARLKDLFVFAFEW